MKRPALDIFTLLSLSYVLHSHNRGLDTRTSVSSVITIFLGLRSIQTFLSYAHNTIKYDSYRISSLFLNRYILALCLSPMVMAKVAVTRGSWEVVNAQMALHYNLGFLFFIGLYDTPIERHLYAVNIHYPGEIRRLTNLGYSYTAAFNSDCSMVILTYSSTKEIPICQLFSISYTSTEISGIVFEPITYLVSRPSKKISKGSPMFKILVTSIYSVALVLSGHLSRD